MAAHNPKHGPEHKPKVNNSLIAIASIFAIFLIVYFAVTFRAGVVTSTLTAQNLQSADSSGLASGVVTAQGLASCKLIVGQTTIYDDTTLSVSLEAGGATYYSGYTVGVVSVNDDGCVIDVNGNSDYLAVGQIQRLGSLYVTVTDVLK